MRWSVAAMLLLYWKAIGGVGMGHEKIKNFAKNFDADFCLPKNCLRAVPVSASRPSAPYPPASSQEPTANYVAARFCAGHLPWALWAVWVDLFKAAARVDPTTERPPGFGSFGSSHLKSVFDFGFDDLKRPKASGDRCRPMARGRRFTLFRRFGSSFLKPSPTPTTVYAYTPIFFISHN